VTTNILYFCPDSPLPSAGVQTLYRHVSHLVKNGFRAAILHHKTPFRAEGAKAVPIRYLDSPGVLRAGDIVVIPEGFPNLMEPLRDKPVRKVAICQNWSYVYPLLPLGVDWRSFGVERILTYPDLVGEYLAWAMQLPVHVFDWGIQADLFVFRPEEKVAQICYIKRKQGNVDEFRRMLRSRNPAFLSGIRWLAMDNLPQAEYARELRRSIVFLGLSTTEGLYAPYLESMRSGTIVAGYDAVGGKRALVGKGPSRNCITAENHDYFALGMQLEPLLRDILAGDLSAWQPIVENALEFSARFTLEREEESVVSIWRSLLCA
jgi:glycosyltransferase involved in cell wall biosynthesis